MATNIKMNHLVDFKKSERRNKIKIKLIFHIQPWRWAYGELTIACPFSSEVL